MCLKVKDNVYIEIAKEDILCYKFVKRGFLNLFWYSPLYEKKARRKYNKVLKAVDHLKLECEDPGFRSSDFFIGQGYHAFLTEKAAMGDYIGGKILNTMCDLRQVIIPKGSEYCLGEFGTIVSNQIIVTRNVFICKRR
jgi:hypothetical protein